MWICKFLMKNLFNPAHFLLGAVFLHFQQSAGAMNFLWIYFSFKTLLFWLDLSVFYLYPLDLRTVRIFNYMYLLFIPSFFFHLVSYWPVRFSWIFIKFSFIAYPYNFNFQFSFSLTLGFLINADLFVDWK